MRKSAMTGLFRGAGVLPSELERLTISFVCLNFAVLAALALADPTRGPSGGVQRAWTMAWVLIAVAFSVMWFLGLMTHEGRGAVLFGVAIDVGTSSCLLMFSSPADATIGTALFVITGAFFTFYLSRRWLVAHLVFSSLVIVLLAAMTVAARHAEAFATGIRSYVIFIAVMFLPLTIQVM